MSKNPAQPALLHWSRDEAFRAVCGADGKNQMTTCEVASVTCPKCLARRFIAVQYDSKEFQGAVRHILAIRGVPPTAAHKRKAAADLRGLLECLQSPDTRSVSSHGCFVIEYEHLEREELELEGVRVVSIYILPTIERGRPRRLEPKE